MSMESLGVGEAFSYGLSALVYNPGQITASLWGALKPSGPAPREVKSESH